MSISILGISAYCHDSAAALLRDGEIVVAAQEERFTRKKYDARFPARAARWCLADAGLQLAQVDTVVCHDSGVAEARLRADLAALAAADEGMGATGAALPSLLAAEHARSHAASAFFPSPFRRAAVLCLDGVGEWAATSAWLGEDNRLLRQWEVPFPHSLGLLYSIFTEYCGFKVNSGEYKLMGLAPYGEPKYVDLIRGRLIEAEDDGTFRLETAYFDFAPGVASINERFRELFGGQARTPEAPLAQRHMDLARSVQVVTEDVILKLAHAVRRQTGAENLCLAGDMALNCVANGRLLREGPFESIWVQPAAGDAGGALGAAMSIWYETLGNARRRENGSDAMKGAYLGPSYDDAATEVGAGRRGCSLAATRRSRAVFPRREAAGRRPRRRLDAGPDGVRSSRSRRALDPRRSAQPEDAVADEPED